MNRTLFAAVALIAAAAGAVMVRAQPPQDAPPRPQWEYRVLSALELAGLEEKPTLDEMRDEQLKQEREAAVTERLRRLGAEGWELVEVEEDHFYFKRLGAGGAGALQD